MTWCLPGTARQSRCSDFVAYNDLLMQEIKSKKPEQNVRLFCANTRYSTVKAFYSFFSVIFVVSMVNTLVYLLFGLKKHSPGQSLAKILFPRSSANLRED